MAVTRERHHMHWLRDERGSSLLVTLVLITVATVLAGAVLAAQLAQYRFIRRDAHRLQARYTAEAGVYAALDSLQTNPVARLHGYVFALPDGQASRVTVEGFGGYLFVRAVANYRRSRSTVRALVGEVPPAGFDNAVVLWDTESSLHLAGRTAIDGDIVVGPRGVRESTYRRRRFTGRHDGNVYAIDDLEPPFFEGHHLQQATLRLDDLPGRPGHDAPYPEGVYEPARHLPSENPVYATAGSLHLTAADSTLLATPRTIIAGQDLTIEGPLRYPPGTTFVAGRVLRLRGPFTGREGLFYGRDGIAAGDSVRCAGQFFSRGFIRVARGAYLGYPSVLYVTGEGAEAGAAITVEGSAAVDGTLVYPRLEPPPARPGGRIVVAPAAHLRGAVFNAHETEFHGRLDGSLLTHQLYFYESPTHYVNWLKDAAIDAGARPATYLLPLRFSPRPRLAVGRWDVHVEEPEVAL